MKLANYRAALYSPKENLHLNRRTDEATRVVLRFEEASFQIGLELAMDSGIEVADGVLRTDAKGIRAFVALPWEIDLSSYTQHRSIDVELYVDEYPEEGTYLATGTPALDGGAVYHGFRPTEGVYETTSYRGKESDSLFDEVATLKESGGFVLENVSTGSIGRLSQKRARDLSDSRQLEAVVPVEREMPYGGVM
jgi:hypothetical protein